MNIITEPTVYLIGKQTMQDAELSRFLADHGVNWDSDSDRPAEVLTETAGRVCYMSFANPRPGGNSAYLDHIKGVGHGSVLEHAVWNFIITGVSRSLTHELVRHRAGWSYSQLSQRYVDESVAEYIVPDILRASVDAAQQKIEATPGMDHSPHNAAVFTTDDEYLGALWLDAINHAHEAYIKLADKLAAKFADSVVTPQRKAARQAARSVLPNATETKIFVTANARALRHFLEQRGSRHAEPEIRKLAGKLLELLAGDSPNLFGDYYRVPLYDGTDEIRTPYPKV